ncbi:Swarming motility protein ybiA [Candidatus Saccharibacteria bacterium]|nr:MAG: Swarming motility protein ybiA [Candidatus Saccharibacteria bacterium]
MYPEPDQQLTYQTDDEVYFFTHAYDPLSNWSAHAVGLWGYVFPTAEHAFQWRKFDGREPDIASAILRARSPWEVIQINRTLGQGKLPPQWREHRAGVMAEILRAKAAQHEDVRTCLRQTGARKIIENHPTDDYWGCGPTGAGENMMGVLWMTVREELE